MSEQGGYGSRAAEQDRAEPRPVGGSMPSRAASCETAAAVGPGDAAGRAGTRRR
ncbi:hypothetical protein [Actinomadura spongiicola]|uniref:hypothetical protein n=1 Tax=Actinomadura spongiicola TaxID=2303421 RepID=UPI0013149676|nr:hypothetical protein [Actinomadura spongiicola]